MNIDTSREDEQSYLAANDSAASSISMNIRPSGGIRVLNLESVEFIMAICVTRNRAVSRKRMKREAAKETSDVGELSTFLSDTAPKEESLGRSHPSWTSSSHRKGVNQDEYGHGQACSPETHDRENVELNGGSPNGSNRKRSATSHELAATVVTNHSSESVRIEILIDAGLRFSIYLTLRGSSYNFKVKAHTFVHGLANVAPILWRAGYPSVTRILVFRGSALDY